MIGILELLRAIICPQPVEVITIEPEEPKKPTDYKVFSMHWEDLVSLLTENGLEIMLKANFEPDYDIYYSDEEGWASIVPFLTYSAEYFAESERKDCDDYSKKAAADAGFDFGLYGVQAWGDSPYGRHAFDLAITSPTTFKLWEPNAGFVEVAGGLFEQGEYGWRARSWK